MRVEGRRDETHRGAAYTMAHTASRTPSSGSLLDEPEELVLLPGTSSKAKRARMSSR